MMPAPFIELEVQYVDKASFDRSLASMCQVGTRVDRSTDIIRLCFEHSDFLRLVPSLFKRVSRKPTGRITAV